MKATELRIGNYFLYDDRIQVVNGVIQMNGGYRIDFKTEHKRKLVKYCHPIPLTEEWLLKFGFKKLSSFTFCGKPTFHLNIHVTISTIINYKELSEFNVVGSNISLCVVDDKFHILKNVCSDNEYIEEGIEVPYIHQLQNLYFALTGEELKIKEHETI